MNRLGLSDADFALYLDACAQNHRVSVSVDLLNNNGDTLLSFDQGRANDRDVTVEGGEVAVDATWLVGRVLTLTVIDPGRLLNVSQDANYTDRMLRVSVGVQVAAFPDMIRAVVFVGPIVSAPRSGDVVQFTAHGKARFAQHGLRDKYTLPAGMAKTTAIKKMLNELAGESYANMGDIPDLPDALTEDLVLDLADRPWGKCRVLASSLTRHLTYDGPGQVRFQRTDVSSPVYTFTSAVAAPSVLSSLPITQTDWSTIKNAVRVTGGTTATTSAPVAYAFADPVNPFSAQTLGRAGAPAYFWDFQVIDTVKTQATAQQIADNTLARDLVANREIKFESFPMYVFDEYDLIQVDTSELTAQTRLAQFTIPLGVEGSPLMSYGWNARRSSDRFAKSR